MLRRGATAIHYVCEEIPEGSEVDLAIDWSRRFDHMQQHSGKHLYMIIFISACRPLSFA